MFRLVDYQVYWWAVIYFTIYKPTLAKLNQGEEPVQSSNSIFHPDKLSIVLMGYYVDGGRIGRGECN